MLLELLWINKHTSGIITVFLDNEDGSNDVYIVKNATPAGANSLEVMSGNKLVVQNDGSNADVLRVESSRALSSLDATITVLEDV